MATIGKYQSSSGATLYRVRYRTPENRQTDKRGFRTKREAEAFANTVEVSKLRGEYVAPRNARVTLDELGPSWLDRQRGHLKPSGYAVIETTWPVMGAAALGSRRPRRHQTDRCTEVDLGLGSRHTRGQAARRECCQARAPRLVADPGRRGTRPLIVANPAAGIALPRASRKRPVYLTHSQVAALAASSGEYEGLVLFLAYTGLRWGEAVGLRVRDLDMLRKRASISENAVQSGKQIFVGTPKAHKQRSVPLPAFLLPYLARQCEGKDPDGLLWPGDDGNHLRRPHPVSGWFAKAVTASRAPRVTPHDLRHSAASLAVSAGANVKAVQRMLGHASAAMTLDIYADLFDDDLEAVAAALDRARSNSSQAG